jgi:hypothetical protein
MKYKEEDLFKLFVKHDCESLGLYEDIKRLIGVAMYDSRGTEAARYYSTLVSLMNSENNAGWEERHSKRIDTLNEALHHVADNYEEYLP